MRKIERIFLVGHGNFFEVTEGWGD
jgi:hypothetical protein